VPIIEKLGAAPDKAEYRTEDDWTLQPWMYHYKKPY
jgi:hypothetical protein